MDTALDQNVGAFIQSIRGKTTLRKRFSFVVALAVEDVEAKPCGV